jgi:hypothetical protein|tara:strand:- start:97 stop:627 length:531 start_codon:yes stop_codon:yes gene_type:complete
MKTIEIKECTKLRAIRNEVVNKFNADITKKNRNRELVYGRAVYYKLCKNLTSHSLTDIGSFIYKDHATVLHGLKLFETFELNNDYYYLTAYEEMFDKLKLNYVINIKNPRDLKTKYYKYVNENINLKEKNKNIRVLIKEELKDIFSQCTKEFGYVPQTAYLKQRFAKINELLKKIS